MNDQPQSVERLRQSEFLQLSSSGEASDRRYVCPGSHQSIDRSVHLARLHAAWDVCDHCEWNSDTEGLAQRTVNLTTEIRNQRATGIRRTEFGIRGQYINAIDRMTASRLIQLFCRHFTTDSEVLQQEEDASATSRHPLPTLVAGYDGRNCSPDIFVGVITAITEYGLPVLDIGCTTHASLLEAIRSFPEAAGGIIVTGAGTRTSFTGFDVFDRQGGSVPVSWQNEGFELRSVTADHENDDNDEEGSSKSAIERSERNPLASERRQIILIPGENFRRQPIQRACRSSGHHQVISFEDDYRHWVRRWYPERCTGRVVLHTDSKTVAERLHWLAQSCGFEAVCRPANDPLTTIPGALTVWIGEDDRIFSFFDSARRKISGTQLADTINRSRGTASLQLTAHADEQSGRFWLTDAGRPSSGFATEQIQDAVVVTGLLMRLKHSGSG
jgi:hypothetical protein